MPEDPQNLASSAPRVDPIAQVLLAAGLMLILGGVLLRSGTELACGVLAVAAVLQRAGHARHGSAVRADKGDL